MLDWKEEQKVYDLRDEIIHELKLFAFSFTDFDRQVVIENENGEEEIIPVKEISYEAKPNTRPGATERIIEETLSFERQIIVDALLNDKSEKAQKAHAKLEFKGFVPTMGITKADLCIIMANAIDNAIESCAKDYNETIKSININADFKQGYFFLKISNPMFETVKINGKKAIEVAFRKKGSDVIEYRYFDYRIDVLGEHLEDEFENPTPYSELSDEEKTLFDSEQTYNDHLVRIKERSESKYDVEVTKDDKILTLSSCTPLGFTVFILFSSLIFCLQIRYFTWYKLYQF